MTRTLFLLLTTFFCALTSFIEGVPSKENVLPKTISDSELNIRLLDISAAPSSIVGGSVNVITGSYIEQECDLVIPGAVSLSVQRYFNSASKERGTLCHGWDLNLPSKLRMSDETPVVPVNHFDWKSVHIKNPIVAEINDRGMNLVFAGLCNKDMKISDKQLKFGVTNCSTGILSSRTNIRNKKFYCASFGGKTCVLYGGLG